MRASKPTAQGLLLCGGIQDGLLGHRVCKHASLQLQLAATRPALPAGTSLLRTVQSELQ